jgi:SAM-dependent methyltransferase
MQCCSRNLFVRPYSRIASAYNALTGFGDFRRAKIAFERLVRFYGIHFRSAVDVGCGTGLFACYLNRRWGIPVIGVDRSPEMLATAARNCPNLDVHFLCQDFRDLCLPWRVELATANTCTLNHLINLHQLHRGFRRVHDNLIPGGHFLFDLITDRQPRHWIRGMTRRLRFRGMKIVHTTRWDQGRKLLTIVIVHSPIGPWPSTTEVYLGRGYSIPDVGRCLQRAGFLLRGIHDARTLRMATRSSPKVIFVAVKK